MALHHRGNSNEYKIQSKGDDMDKRRSSYLFMKRLLNDDQGPENKKLLIQSVHPHNTQVFKNATGILKFLDDFSKWVTQSLTDFQQTSQLPWIQVRFGPKDTVGLHFHGMPILGFWVIVTSSHAYKLPHTWSKDFEGVTFRVQHDKSSDGSSGSQRFEVQVALVGSGYSDAVTWIREYLVLCFLLVPGIDVAETDDGLKIQYGTCFIHGHLEETPLQRSIRCASFIQAVSEDKHNFKLYSLWNITTELQNTLSISIYCQDKPCFDDNILDPIASYFKDIFNASHLLHRKLMQPHITLCSSIPQLKTVQFPLESKHRSLSQTFQGNSLWILQCPSLKKGTLLSHQYTAFKRLILRVLNRVALTSSEWVSPDALEECQHIQDTIQQVSDSLKKIVTISENRSFKEECLKTLQIQSLDDLEGRVSQLLIGMAWNIKSSRPKKEE